jgi:hypothetical protein
VGPVWLGDDAITEDSPHGCMRGWGFPLSLPPPETHIDLQVKCPLLMSDFNQHFSKILQYQIS